MKIENITLEGLGAILAVGISLIALLNTIFSSKKQLNDSLDSKSGWRKELFDVASKEDISIGDLYRIRSSLRIFRHNNNPRTYSFNWMTNFMIIILDSFIDYCEESKKNRCANEFLVDFEINTEKSGIFDVSVGRNKSIGKLFTKKELDDYVCPRYVQDITRIFSRYLLKNHWDYNLAMMPNNSIVQKKYANKSQEIAQQTFLQVIRILIKEDNLMSEYDENREKLIMELNKLIDEINKQPEKNCSKNCILIILKCIMTCSIIIIGGYLFFNYKASFPENLIFLASIFLFFMITYFIIKDY